MLQLFDANLYRGDTLMAASTTRAQCTPSKVQLVQCYDLLLLTNVGVTETTPMKNKVAIELKS